MKYFWKILNVLLAVIGVLLLYYYFVQPNSTFEKMKSDAKPHAVTIAWIGPLTGPASAFGIDSLKALELAVAQYQLTKSKDDPEIRLVVGDDSYDSNRTEHEYRKIMNFDHPQMLMMLTYSGLLKIADNATKDNVIVVNSLDNDLNLAGQSNNIFLIGKETEELAGLYADHIMKQNKKNVLILYNSQDGFMTWLGNTLSQILSSSGVKHTMVEYHPESPDFKPKLEAAKSKDYDAYVFLGHKEIAPAMNIAREIGITAQFYAGSILPDPDFQEEAKGVVEGTLFAYLSASEGNQLKAEEFLRSFKQKNRRIPIIEWPAMQSYDAANLLIQSIKQVYGQDGNFTENLRNALLHTSNFPGVTGTLTVQENGSVRGIHPTLYIIKDGKPVRVRNNE